MTEYLLPTDDTFVEQVAKAIARNRVMADAEGDISNITFALPGLEGNMDKILDTVFESVWAGTDVQDMAQKRMYRADALAAISAINLKLLTLGE